MLWALSILHISVITPKRQLSAMVQFSLLIPNFIPAECSLKNCEEIPTNCWTIFTVEFKLWESSTTAIDCWKGLFVFEKRLGEWKNHFFTYQSFGYFYIGLGCSCIRQNNFCKESTSSLNMSKDWWLDENIYTLLPGPRAYQKFLSGVLVTSRSLHSILRVMLTYFPSGSQEYSQRLDIFEKWFPWRFELKAFYEKLIYNINTQNCTRNVSVLESNREKIWKAFSELFFQELLLRQMDISRQLDLNKTSRREIEGDLKYLYQTRAYIHSQARGISHLLRNQKRCTESLFLFAWWSEVFSKTLCKVRKRANKAKLCKSCKCS